MLKLNLLPICFFALNFLQIGVFAKVNDLKAKSLKEAKIISIKKDLNPIKKNNDIQTILVDNFYMLAENIEEKIINDENLNAIEVTSDTKSQDDKFFTA